MWTPRNSLILLPILLVALTQQLQCPFYAQIPFQLFKNNLYFNQHELLNNLFTYTQGELLIDEGTRLEQFESTYIDGPFSKEKFDIHGRPNQTIEVTVNDIKIHYIFNADKKLASQVKRSLVTIENGLNQVSFDAEFSKLKFSFQFLKNEQGHLYVDIVGFEIMNGLTIVGDNGSDMFQAIVEKSIQERFLSSYEWKMKNWLEVLPFGSVQLGYLFYKIFSSNGYPNLSEDEFFYCPSFSEQNIGYTTAQEILDRQVKDVQQPHALLQFNQQEFNKELRVLHTSDKIWKLPLSESQIQSALEPLKDKFQSFKDSQSFEVSAFFSEERFEQHWDEDEYVKSNLKIEKDGNMTLTLNVGLDLTNYDGNQQVVNKRTILTKLSVKIQLQNPTRYTRSQVDKKRLQIKVHHAFITAFQMYDEDSNLLNMESMMALVGFNQELSKNLQVFMDQFDETFKDTKLYYYNGDIQMTRPRDAMGMHWLRIYTEVEPNNYLRFVIMFEVEDGMINPERYESSKKYELTSNAISKKLDKAYVTGPFEFEDSYSFAFRDIIDQYCKEDIEERGMSGNQTAFEICQLVWGPHFHLYIVIRTNWLVEINGEIYRIRIAACVLVQCALLLIVCIYLRILRKSYFKNDSDTDNKKGDNKQNSRKKIAKID